MLSDGFDKRCGIAIDTGIFDLARAKSAGLFADTGLTPGTFPAGSLNGFLGHSRGIWSAVRGRVTDLLTAGNSEGEAFAQAHGLLTEHDVDLHLPVEIGDYVDFHSSLQHATNEHPFTHIHNRRAVRMM